MGIQRYLFFSIFNCDKHPQVPLMNIKACTEKFLASSGVPYTALRLTGFHQVRHAAARGRLYRGGSSSTCPPPAPCGARPGVEAARSHGCRLLHCQLDPSSGSDAAIVRGAAAAVVCPCAPQAVIGNYAVPILEDKTVWGTTDQSRTAYLDSLDVARMAMAALR